MNIRKMLVDTVHPDEKFVERIVELLAGPPNEWNRDEVLRVMTERNARLYGPELQKEADWNELGMEGLLHNIEILIRLEKALGSWLSLAECVVLAQVVYLYHFLYSDGFLINDPRDQGMPVGKSEGAALAACFHPDPEVTYLVVEYSARTRIPEWQIIKERIMQRILSSDNVRLVGFDDLPSLVA